ncbi:MULTISPECIES: PleD family two-component system response regulator [unclassified Thioalkalivibrio]|uniref:response regulator n=1 Tax=unclassified Thioalkalivibrio TaxID=2621013 RepID=UPI000376AC44|nr:MULTISPECIES: response regulator [unclassified Thioalkalivibrio]
MSYLQRMGSLLRFGKAGERRRKARREAARGLRVLVVDDSRTVVALLSSMLRQNEMEPVGAGDAEQALALARENPPDLIFLDIILPGMTGFAMLRQLRRDPVTAKVPVIMISGNEDAVEQFFLDRIGSDDFMKKPFGRGEVFSRIERLVEQGRLPARPLRFSG